MMNNGVQELADPRISAPPVVELELTNAPVTEDLIITNAGESKNLVIQSAEFSGDNAANFSRW